jgi:hypothetical protein
LFIVNREFQTGSDHMQSPFGEAKKFLALVLCSCGWPLCSSQASDVNKFLGAERKEFFGVILNFK